MEGQSLRAEFRRQVRERVLEAAHQHALARGWDRVRIGEVAVTAKVSRPTLYREFGTKDGVGEALIAREAERFFDGIATILDEADDVATGILRGTAHTLTEADANPLLHAVLTGAQSEHTTLLPFLTTRSAAIITRGRTLLTTWVMRVEPGHSRDRVEETVDAVARLVVSHLVAPSVSHDEVAERMWRLTRSLLVSE